MRRILCDKRLVLCWQFFQRKDRPRRANWDARPAINAIRRVHIELRSSRKIGFLFCGVNTIYRAGFDAVLVFSTGIDNHVGHIQFSIVLRCNRRAKWTKRQLIIFQWDRQPKFNIGLP